MPRPPRLHVSGGCYHVILRGNHLEALFASGSDRRILNRIVAEVVESSNARVHAFCWMTNHLHALIQVADRPLGGIMQRIAMRYSRCRHKALQTTGHLFERRYRAKLVDVDAYFLTLLRYIHLNPVTACLVRDPSDYPWSSHRAYLGAEAIHWLTTDFGLSLFSTDATKARTAYREFMLEPVDNEIGSLDEESHPDDPRILGSDQFIARIPVSVYRPRSPLTLEQLAEKICLEHNVAINRLRSPSRARALTAPRIAIACTAVERRIATVSEVARFLGRDPSALTQLLARYRRKGR